MSLESEHGLNQHAEAGHESKKKSVISYSREFLLSLSGLDVCKELPSGFDQSILSEFEDAPPQQDRFFRSSGSLSTQSYRRTEYGSSPPTRGDMGNYSRGNLGRWDSRSSGKSDRDSDSQSDWDSDPGKRYDNQTRRPWQVPEHDGLLGSGSFPRPTGYTAGTSAPKFRANDHYSLNKNNEPYHPPRPYKAVPHSRRDTDSYNDETFGSSEYTSEDRAEEERKRRDSFELLRKEQHKAFQEKQKSSPEKSKDNFDISELSEDSKDEKTFLDRRNESDEPVIKPVSKNDLDKSALSSPAPVSRPLVPPGFSSTIVEKNSGIKPVTQFQPAEERSILRTKGNRLSNATSGIQEEKQSLDPLDLGDKKHGGLSVHLAGSNQSEKIQTFISSLGVSSGVVGTESTHYKTSKLPESLENPVNNEIIELDSKSIARHEIVGNSSPTRSTSILDQLFGSALTLNDVGSSSFIEQHDAKADDAQDTLTSQSSRFARWFLEEENKPMDDPSSGRSDKPVDDLSFSRPNDLLSLLAGGEKGGFGRENSGSQAFDVRATNGTPLSFPLQGTGPTDLLVTSDDVPVSVQNIDKLEGTPAVLTCEDLEQSILSEITESGPMLHPPNQGWGGSSGAKVEQQKIDDHASQHLFSLLTKGTDLSTNLGVLSADKVQNVEKDNLDIALDSREKASDNIKSTGGALTLETLFGTAFMQELQSVGTTKPGHRGSVGSVGVDDSVSLFPSVDNNLLASMPGITSGMRSHSSSLLASNHRPQIESERLEETFLGFNSHNQMNSLQIRPELGSQLGAIDRPVEIGLPEEDSLMTANDPPNIQSLLPARNAAKTDLLLTSETQVDIAEKLAALSTVYRDDRPVVGSHEGPAFFHSPYDLREPDGQFHKVHNQQSSPQLYPSQMNHQGPMFPPLESHPSNFNAQMKFIAPENIIHHDPPNQQFPANLLRPPFQHHSTGVDPSPHHPVLQQMQLPGNFPPPHLLQGFPRGGPLPTHLNNQVTGFIQEPNSMQGFPFGQRQLNFGGIGIPSQAPDTGGGSLHPETLQRLIGMELREKSKPIHPLAAPGHSQGIHGHERDMGFGYR